MEDTHLIPKGQFIKTDGTIKIVQPKNGTDFEFEELRGYVNGHIEIINLRNGTILVLNEEGKLEGLPINAIATVLFQRAFQGTLDYIVGNVLYCDQNLVK